MTKTNSRGANVASPNVSSHSLGHMLTGYSSMKNLYKGASFGSSTSTYVLLIAGYLRSSVAFHVPPVCRSSSSPSSNELKMGIPGGWGGLGGLFDSVTRLGDANAKRKDDNGAVVTARSRVKLGDLSVSPMGECSATDVHDTHTRVHGYNMET